MAKITLKLLFVFTFTIISHAQNQVNYFTIDTDSIKWTVSNYLVGTHSVYSFEPDAFYKDGSYVEWLKHTGINTMRYPGGTVVKYWDWENPSGILNRDTWAPDWSESERIAPEKWLSLDEYIAIVKKTNMTPLLGVNITSGHKYNRVEESIARAKKMVQYVKDAGLGGAFWYLGNEGGNGGLENEAKLYALHAKAMKEVDPSIKCMFNQNNLTPTYLKKYLKIAGDYIDVAETHGKWPYGGNPKKYAPGTIEEWKVELPMRDRKNHNRAWREEVTILSKAAAEAGYPNLKFANNEYGIGKGFNVRGFDRYTKSLLMIDMLQEHFIGNWYMACYWSQLRRSSEESLASSKNENYRMNAMHYGFEMLAKAQGGKMLHISQKTPNPSVYGFSVAKGSEILVYILNKSEETQNIALQLKSITKNKFALKSASALVNTKDKFGKTMPIQFTSKTKENSFNGQLKPMSYTLITLNK